MHGLLPDHYLDGVRFTAEDAYRANEEWGANCGPGAIAAIYRMTLNELRPRLDEFETRHYTNPTMMVRILNNLSGAWDRKKITAGSFPWPRYGLARIQWEGPWTAPGVPARVAYRHTHWVGSRWQYPNSCQIFDINAMSVGGWLPLAEWSVDLVPWLLKQCEPRADGKWRVTHAIEVLL